MFAAVFVVLVLCKLPQGGTFSTDLRELASIFGGSEDSSPDYQVVYLPSASALTARASGEEFEYIFSAFNRPINLKLKRNDGLIGATFQTFINENDETYPVNSPPKPCHFIHKDDISVGAISACDQHSMQGLIFMGNTTYEIEPFNEKIHNFEHLQEPLLAVNDDRIAHIVKRANFASNIANEDIFATNHLEENLFDKFRVEAASHRPANSLTLELAMFFDEPAFKIFAPYMNNDIGKLQDMLLAYLNGVQALYHHQSLGTSLELVLVRLDIMKQQPSAMPHYEGERGQLLDSFCSYQSRMNPAGDANPAHWDMALYISGLDFFAYENGRKSGVTMGLATVGGVCLDKYACVIAELGTTNVFGKPYPSAGFTSVYILAHEIGHNLGMHHDSVGNSCPKEGFIMSPSRGTNGETQWSSCSAQIMSDLSWAKCLQDSSRPPKHLDHSKFLDNPGQVYTAKKQCEILLKDKDAVVSPAQDLSSICVSMQCKTPHRSGYYFAGPALDGTQCGYKKYCFGGECVTKSPPKPLKVVRGGWSPWKESTCSSGCIENSRGFLTKKRNCNNPTPVNTDAGCEGSSIEYQICSDNQVCMRRSSVVDYASQKCKEFSRLLPELDSKGSGLQAPHETARVWMGCAIFCRNANSGTFYTPRLELNDLGVSPYFPDGTWCHRENHINYYCLHHHCLPENFSFSAKTTVLTDIGDDVPFSQNARPLHVVPPEIKSYFSLGPEGKPLKTVLHPDETNDSDEDWETDDYLEIPEIRKQHQRFHYA